MEEWGVCGAAIQLALERQRGVHEGARVGNRAGSDVEEVGVAVELLAVRAAEAHYRAWHRGRLKMLLDETRPLVALSTPKAVKQFERE